MNVKKLTSVAVTLMTFPVLALAEGEESSRGSSLLSTLFWTVLPFLILGGIAFWFLRRVTAVTRVRQEQLLARHEQHMERVEQYLDRIVKAVEKEDTNANEEG